MTTSDGFSLFEFTRQNAFGRISLDITLLLKQLFTYCMACSVLKMWSLLIQRQWFARMPSYQVIALSMVLLDFSQCQSHRTEGRPDCLEALTWGANRALRSGTMLTCLCKHLSKCMVLNPGLISNAYMTHKPICKQTNGKDFPQQTWLASLHTKKLFLSLSLC